MIVYLITNTVNGKRYVGKTVMTLVRRWTCHVSEARTTSKRRAILNAIRKYGPEAFTIESLEMCDNAETLKNAEIRWIAELKTTDSRVGYNETEGGEGLSHPTAETRQKMSLTHVGKRHSKETKEKMSASHKGCVISASQRELARTRLSRAVEAYSLETGETVATFSSTIAAERETSGKYLSSKISLVCNGKRPHHQNLGWRYLESETSVRYDDSST